MILQRGWFRRRREAAQAAVVLDFFAVDLEAETAHGTYYVERVAPDWTARFRERGARPGARELLLDARHEDGDAMDWPSRGCAEEACRLHAHLMELGHGALRAAELVAQRSQQLIGEWRARGPVVLDYAQPVAVQR